MLEGSPDDVFLNFALAMEHAKAGEHEAALARFIRVGELDPNHTASYFQRAQILIGLGRKPEAKAVLADGIAAAQRAGDKHAASEMSQTLSLIG